MSVGTRMRMGLLLPAAGTSPFADEFATTLNTTIWTPYWFSNLTAIPAGTTPGASANVTVSGGQAHLKFDGTNGAIISSNPHDGVGGHVGFDFQYGYVEVAFTIPNNGSGLIAEWPAIVLFGQAWPLTGEVDFMEGLSGHNNLTYHYGPSGGPQNPPVGGLNDFAPGSHIAAVNWQPGRLDFYQDGVPVRTIQNSDLIAGYSITSSRLYIAIMIQAGPSGGTTPVNLDIDYVRVTPTYTVPGPITPPVVGP